MGVVDLRGGGDQLPGGVRRRERDLVGYRFPGGESFQDLRERVLPAFFEILDGGGTTILVVAHLGVNRVLLSEFLGLPLEELFSVKLGYGAITVIRALPCPMGAGRSRWSPDPLPGPSYLGPASA